MESNGYDTTGKLAERYAITSYLNRAMMGFAEGNIEGLRGLVVDNLKRIFDMVVPREAVKVIVDRLDNPIRLGWSIHVDHAGEHYESVIVNLRYDTGYEL